MGNNIIYVFVSHSHKDLHAVRLIRNYLEQKGAEPILFFLKSLSDKDEITGLIKREIDARIWFIYCKSKNSEESKWVKSELNYVYKQRKENVLTIDLDFCLDTKNELNDATKNLIDHALFKMIKLSRIYASYSPSDREIFLKFLNI